MSVKEIIDNAIIIGTCLAFVIIAITYLVWYLSSIRKQVKYLSVKLKYYDIMQTKFQAQYPNHICSIYEKDLNVFSKEEKKYIQSYIKNLENLRIFMKGSSKTFGLFM
jgi:hypothetical protein